MNVSAGADPNSQQQHLSASLQCIAWPLVLVHQTAQLPPSHQLDGHYMQVSVLVFFFCCCAECEFPSCFVQASLLVSNPFFFCCCQMGACWPTRPSSPPTTPLPSAGYPWAGPPTRPQRQRAQQPHPTLTQSSLLKGCRSVTATLACS